MDQDSFRFLRPWHQLLPPAGGAVVTVSGSGGCTTTLLRLVEVYRERGARVLVTHTVDRPVPVALADARCSIEASAARDRLDAGGVAYVTGEGDARAHAFETERLAAFAHEVGADAVLVEVATPNGGRLRTTPDAPAWPDRVHLAVVVGHLGLVGRPWTERTVEGAGDEAVVDGEVRRVTSADVVAGVQAGVDAVPAGVRSLPFLTGFGAYRDLDGMFAAVSSLLSPPERPVLCFGELLGDERREAADRRGLEESLPSAWLDDERVYAIYPSALDEP